LVLNWSKEDIVKMMVLRPSKEDPWCIVLVTPKEVARSYTYLQTLTRVRYTKGERVNTVSGVEGDGTSKKKRKIGAKQNREGEWHITAKKRRIDETTVQVVGQLDPEDDDEHWKGQSIQYACGVDTDAAFASVRSKRDDYECVLSFLFPEAPCFCF
jgi:hypothetical protein